MDSIYYSKEDEYYGFFYDKEEKLAWAVHMPKLVSGNTGVGRDVGSFEGIQSKEEAWEKLKNMVDDL